MYRQPDHDEPLLFGDVFSSDWLFDAFINEDAVPLYETLFQRGGRGYAPVTPQGPQTRKDFILAHGEHCRAILLSDDCEIESCLERAGGRRRLIFAAVTPWPSDSDAAAKARRMTTFRRHPLEPAGGFDGGIAELHRLFAVSGRALLDAHGRLVALEDDARALLEQRWAAFATRRGPLAATDNGTKLAHVLDARGDAARFELLLGGDALPNGRADETGRSVARVLTQSWRTEGEIMLKIADVHEARGAGDDEVPLLESELRKLAEFATAAADQLREQLDGS